MCLGEERSWLMKVQHIHSLLSTVVQSMLGACVCSYPGCFLPGIPCPLLPARFPWLLPSTQCLPCNLHFCCAEVYNLKLMLPRLPWADVILGSEPRSMPRLIGVLYGHFSCGACAIMSRVLLVAVHSGPCTACLPCSSCSQYSFFEYIWMSM